MFTYKIGYEIAIRQKRYQYFLQQVGDIGICDHLEKDGITPYIVPIYCPESKNEKIINALKEIGIETGLYHFDVNRNLLSPKFIQCIRIPCHSGISDDKFNVMTELIRKCHRN